VLIIYKKENKKRLGRVGNYYKKVICVFMFVLFMIEKREKTSSPKIYGMK